MTASDDLTKSLRRNASWLFSGSMVASLFAAVEPVLLARFLGVEQLGLFSLVIAYVSIVKNVLVNFRSPEGITRYVGHHLALGEKDKVLRFMKFFYLIDLLEGFLAFAVCLLLAGVANDLFIHSDDTLSLIVIYATSLFISSINRNSEAVLKVFDKYKTSAFLKIVSPGTRVIMVAACLFLGFKIQGVLVCYVASAIIYLVALQLAVSGVLKSRGFKRWTTARLGRLEFVTSEVRSFIFTSIYSNFLGALYLKEVAVLIVGYFTSKEAVGLYKVAITFLGLREKVQHPILEAMYPSLVTARTRNLGKAFAEIVSHAVKSLMKILLPAGMLFLLFADEITVILFGAEYKPAADAMRIVAIAEILSGLYFWTDPVDLALNRLRQRILRITTCSVFYFAALFILVPAYSYNGAAAAMLVYSVLMLAFSYYYRAQGVHRPAE